MDIKERVKQFIDYKGITVRAFETQCNLSNGYIGSMRKGFGIDKLNNVLIKFPELNRDWLLYGEGEMLKEGSQDRDRDREEAIEEEEEKIPLLPVEAIAGRAIGEAYGVTINDCRMIRNPIPGATLAIKVSGDSMLPDIQPGTTLYIKKILSKTFVPWGHAVVIDTIDGSLVKKIYPADDSEEYIIAKSTNPDYPPYKVYTEDIVGIYRILGTTHVNSTM